MDQGLQQKLQLLKNEIMRRDQMMQLAMEPRQGLLDFGCGEDGLEEGLSCMGDGEDR